MYNCCRKQYLQISLVKLRLRIRYTSIRMASQVKSTRIHNYWTMYFTHSLIKRNEFIITTQFLVI